ncbi:MAG: recombinase family protein [Alteromonadaceae bacterium]|nr:recombinase family protein [Alteromonadaceae bacterium]
MAKADKPRYPALKIIAAWYKVFGYFVGAILAIGGLLSIVNSDSAGLGLGLLIGAVIFVVISVATAELIQAFLDTEDNTRTSAELLQKLVDLQGEPKQTPKSPAKEIKPNPTRNAAKKKATPDQADSIRRLIHNLSSDGLTAEQIARDLTQEGMPTLDGTAIWTAEAVSEVLKEG